MNWSTVCAAVIPCLNEEEGIHRLVTEVLQHLPTVLVIDDGSSDATSSTALAAGAQVLTHPSSRGKGAALAAGWARATALGCEWVITLDGDGQHSPDDLPAFFRSAETTGARLVIGNRMHHSAPMPWLRRRVNQWLSQRISALVGTPIPDSQCGFRLIHLPSLADTDITASHFEIESDLLLQFALHRFPIQFIPIQTIYAAERSKIRPLRDTLRWIQWWVKARRQAAQFRKDRSEKRSTAVSAW